MAKSPVEYESRRCTCAGKEDQPAHLPRGPGPCDTRINARQATATPCSSRFSREWRERGSATGVGLPPTSSLRGLCRLWSNKHPELKVSLDVLLREIGSSDRDAAGLFVGYNGKRCSKNYHGNNWLVAPKRRKNRCFLILRCRFFLSLRCKIRLALGCSPANRERQLGLDRHETD